MESNSMKILFLCEETQLREGKGRQTRDERPNDRDAQRNDQAVLNTAEQRPFFPNFHIFDQNGTFSGIHTGGKANTSAFDLNEVDTIQSKRGNHEYSADTDENKNE